LRIWIPFWKKPAVISRMGETTNCDATLLKLEGQCWRMEAQRSPNLGELHRPRCEKWQRGWTVRLQHRNSGSFHTFLSLNERVTVKTRAWTEEDDERLKALIASGASALRVSVALKRSLPVIRKKALLLGTPFPNASELRARRRQIFQNSIDGPRRSAPVRMWNANE
jgi:hypothetical protein